MGNKLLLNLKYDIPAAIVVFLVAVPLCLGIALASGAPFTSGILAGIIGGLIIPLISRSQMSVSGPAAGLTAVVLVGINDLGSFEAFILAVFFAGLIQIALGITRAGYIAYFFPLAVIKGMLAAIGLILILKQFPHAVGYDIELFGLDSFQVSEEENTLTLFFHSLEHVEWGAFVISIISLGILILWESSSTLKNIRWMPGALIVVVLSVFINLGFHAWFPELYLEASHRVALPVASNFSELMTGIHFPDWSYLSNSKVYTTALTIGIIASVETLLTIEAVDKLDPFKRKSPLNRELIAQGMGNTIAGLIGGIPVTSVIVRSSAGINAGGRTKMTALFHGIFLLISVVFFAKFLNMVPLASLAAILLVVGYKLARPSVIKAMYQKGWDQFIPFVLTIVAILLTDLLIGITAGIIIGLAFVVRTNFHSPISVISEGNNYLIRFTRDVSFLNKAILNKKLESIPNNAVVTIDGTNAKFIDNDVMELLQEFEEQAARFKNITVRFKNISSIKFSTQPLYNNHHHGKQRKTATASE